MENQEDQTPSKVVASDDVLEADFVRWSKAMGLDVDPDGMSDKDLESLEDSKEFLFKSMRQGHLVVDEDCHMVFTPQYSDNDAPITFYEMKGAYYLSMDGFADNQGMAKTFAVMAKITHEQVKRFKDLHGPDIKLCTTIAGLFLG